MEVTYLEQAVSSYGYLAVFAGAFFEGETVFLLGEIAARHGLLSPWPVALAALFGGFLGDQFFFMLGLRQGRWVLRRVPRWSEKVHRVQHLVKKRSVLIILASRYLYGLRMVIPVACGLAGVRPRLFVTLNLVSAILWSSTWGSLGYLLRDWIYKNLGMLKNIQLAALLALAAMLVLVFGLHRLARHFVVKGP